MDVRTDGLLLLLRELNFRDPACSTSDLRGRHEVRISLEPAGGAVHEVRLVELGEHGRFVVHLQGVIGHLGGIGTGQEVPLVVRIDQQASTLARPSERADVGVREVVSERGTHLEEAGVLVLVTGPVDPLIDARLDEVHLKRHHLAPGSEHLPNGGRGHHPHQTVQGRLPCCEVDVRDALLTERHPSVGQVDEEIERCRRVPVPVDGWPDPRVWAGDEESIGILPEARWTVAHPSDSVVEGHTAVHQGRIEHSVLRIAPWNDTTVSEAPEDRLPLGESVLVEAEQGVVLGNDVALEDGAAHALLVTGGAEDERLRGEEALGVHMLALMTVFCQKKSATV